jgi:hypothetical protein
MVPMQKDEWLFVHDDEKRVEQFGDFRHNKSLQPHRVRALAEQLTRLGAKVFFKRVVRPEVDEHGEDTTKANGGKDGQAEIPRRHGLAQVPRLLVFKVLGTEGDHQPVEENGQDRNPRIVDDKVIVFCLLVVQFPSVVSSLLVIGFAALERYAERNRGLPQQNRTTMTMTNHHRQHLRGDESFHARIQAEEFFIFGLAMLLVQGINKRSHAAAGEVGGSPVRHEMGGFVLVLGKQRRGALRQTIRQGEDKCMTDRPARHAGERLVRLLPVVSAPAYFGPCRQSRQ